MLTNTYYTEAAAINRLHELQFNHNRFVHMYENPDQVGQWVVIYDPIASPIDRDALIAEQRAIAA